MAVKQSGQFSFVDALMPAAFFGPRHNAAPPSTSGTHATERASAVAPPSPSPPPSPVTYVSAPSTIACCSAWWRLCEPVAGLAASGRPT